MRSLCMFNVCNKCEMCLVLCDVLKCCHHQLYILWRLERRGNYYIGTSRTGVFLICEEDRQEGKSH